MSIRDQLHDEIDQLEEITESARDRTRELVLKLLPMYLEETGDIRIAMALTARAVEEEIIADATTTAFLAGVLFSQKRAA